MRKLYFLFAVVLFSVGANAQIINFPDANFKAKLLAADPSNQIARNQVGAYVKIDTNADNEIDANEAALIYYLYATNDGQPDNVKISNLSGLEAFYNLWQFYCFSNLLQTLDLTALTQLQTLGCENNQLTSVDLTGLVQLRNLTFNQNNLTQLDLSDKPNLEYLECRENQLTSINITNLPALENFVVNDNNLTSIDFTGVTTITSFQCMYNNISTLDLSHQYNLNLLMCGHNPNLVSVFMKNGKNETGVNFEELPNLQYVCVDESQVGTIANYFNSNNAPNCHVNSYCSFTPGGTYYTIQGTAKYDQNNDGCDASDVHFSHLKLATSSGLLSGVTIFDATGNYALPVGAGTYTITPVLENPLFFTVSPATLTVAFPAMPSPFEQNFCITTNGIHPDLEVVILPLNLVRPGFDASYKIIYKNKGNQAQSGTISFAYNDAVLDLINANPTISSQVINYLNWNFTDLQPFETRTITVTLNVNSPSEVPPVNGGDILNFTASVNSSLTDETPNDNTFIHNQAVVNSFDPNDKTCLEGSTITPEMVGKEIHYMIRFENTGTANAENIVVKDMIDTTKFDINSLTPIDGSHAFRTKISGTNKVEFIFENINLPFDDANNDGYVAFKIKTKPTLVLGNTFSNTASIYFDYNFPIITNTATTTVALLANADFAFDQYFKIYPNPVKDILNIDMKKTIEVTSINLYNTLGQLVLVIPNAQQTKSVDVSSLKTGNYFMKIYSDKGSSNIKIIKQ